MDDTVSVVLITGKPGSGVATFIDQLKKKYPYHEYIKVKYKNF